MVLLAEKFSNKYFLSNSEVAASREPSIEEIERELGFDKIEPIKGLSPSVLSDLEDDREYFREMYEEDLRAYYSRNKWNK